MDPASAATAAQTLKFLGGEEGGGDGGKAVGEGIQSVVGNRRTDTRKRNLMLTGYLACLAFLIFAIGTMDSLIRSLIQNDKFLLFMREWRRNQTRKGGGEEFDSSGEG